MILLFVARKTGVESEINISFFFQLNLSFSTGLELTLLTVYLLLSKKMSIALSASLGYCKVSLHLILDVVSSGLALLPGSNYRYPCFSHDYP